MTSRDGGDKVRLPVTLSMTDMLHDGPVDGDGHEAGYQQVQCHQEGYKRTTSTATVCFGRQVDLRERQGVLACPEQTRYAKAKPRRFCTADHVSELVTSSGILRFPREEPVHVYVTNIWGQIATKSRTQTYMGARNSMTDEITRRWEPGEASLIKDQ